MLVEVVGFQRENDIETKCRKLDEFMAHTNVDRDRSGPLLGTRLSLDTGNRYPPIKVTPQRQMEETLKLMASLIAGLSLERPVLLLFEDAHWIDPISLDALDTLIAHVHRYRVMILVSFRPEFTPCWSGQSHVTSLSLNRLSRRQAAAMVAGTTRGKALPEVVLDQIVAKTDGVPLFVEELTKAVLESGRLAEREDRYELIGNLADPAIPSTLRDSLVARLDRLAGVKEVAHLAACIGREFSHEMLAAVSSLSDAEFKHALDQLVASDLVQRRGFGADASYLFKHALVQDAAYDSLLKSRRLVLHQVIAEILEQRFPERATREPETLARHFALAGMAKKSVAYLLSAASEAANRFSNEEAVAYGQKGLEALSALPPGQDRDHLELLLQATIGWPYAITRGYGAPEVLKAFERARELSNTYSESTHIASLNHGLFNYYLMRAEYGQSAGILQQVERFAA